MAKDTTTIFQQGTLGLLVPGLYDGTITAGELLQHGDAGIGTLTGLNGEVIILDGHAYQAREDGVVREIAADETLPFASVHFEAPDATKALTPMDQPTFEQQTVHDYQLSNVFAAIRIDGTFKHIHTRVAPKQTKPYHTLVEATATQPEFTGDDVQGTIIGYYAPHLFQGATVGGFHLHFLSADHQLGGHLLGFDIDQATLKVQRFADFHVHLPIDNADYLQQKFDNNEIDSAINKAER
ncbi:acetolactate decarboxylase [Lactiplantibacillus fabifermentans]|uniref:Alpha-acetolactate decarboxylase n=2 Tax=Lactiplantibacillus fabifermentans TaxID=483011 RepID=A0A0R2NIT6_9LACO|nr:acetolactate decarboxylase [Lactiplantibacillus fabifermentans]ETY74184.1 alpha-acetolactate decarboxylase [Lactiplantibacillus fabifermentans T30PCM01]KRO25697.1 alpha-acetolactate decarboxylase [Lactiplantibacillus fabifermentans DSM 21115]